MAGDINKMKREFSVVIEQDEDGYFVASVPTLRGCHTQAKSQDVLMKRIKEAIELCLEVQEPEVICFDDRIELVPVRPMHEMRGFLKGLDASFERDEADRV